MPSLRLGRVQCPRVRAPAGFQSGDWEWGRDWALTGAGLHAGDWALSMPSQVRGGLGLSDCCMLGLHGRSPGGCCRTGHGCCGRCAGAGLQRGDSSRRRFVDGGGCRAWGVGGAWEGGLRPWQGSAGAGGGRDSGAGLRLFVQCGVAAVCTWAPLLGLCNVDERREWVLPVWWVDAEPGQVWQGFRCCCEGLCFPARYGGACSAATAEAEPCRV